MPSDLSDRPYAGCLVDGEHRFALRAYYEDTDAGGIVYHANYLRFLERARSDLLGLIGIDHVAALRAGEGSYVIAHVDLRYVAPARLGDALVIASRIVELGRARLVIQQRVMRDRQEIALGRVTAVFVGPEGRLRRQPAAWIVALQALNGAEASG
jgi:acyl-CoA thioester hydrolase